MAAHGVFLALCGFEHDGPRRHLGFRPRQFQDARFRAAFVASEGWGSFEQSGDSVVLAVEHGIVRMRTLALRAPAGPWSRIQACSHGSAQIRAMERDAVVVFEPQVELREGDRLRLALA
jgi:hypothetical protein